ncbi:MAG: hypothetical protein NDI60_02970 [Elusimicrobiales bacterium]|nr:hypothetical protein [Elusimicrobiales bacterium]
MMKLGSIAPAVLCAALCLAACRKPESAVRQEPAPPAAERTAPAAEKPAAAAPRETPAPTAAKPLPKLVLVKPLGERTDTQPMLFQSTAPVAAGAAGNSVTIINNAVPEVQGTAVPAQPPDPKKPVGQPVY